MRHIISSGDPYAHIPTRHFYAQLDELIDLSFVRELTAPLYAETLGRPSLDPVVFVTDAVIDKLYGKRRSRTCHSG